MHACMFVLHGVNMLAAFAPLRVQHVCVCVKKSTLLLCQAFKKHIVAALMNWNGVYSIYNKKPSRTILETV